MKAKAVQKPIYTKYIDSPLGQLIAAVLAKIVEQKKKYPITNDSTVELKHIHKILDAALDILGRIHSTIEYNFCSGGAPGALGIFYIIKDAWSLKGYKDLLQSREEMFHEELKKCFQNVIDSAVKMQGDIATNVVRLLERDKNKFFAKTFEIPGVDLSEYFAKVQVRISCEEMFNLELKECLNTVNEQAARMRGNKADNVTYLLRKDQQKYFPRTLATPGLTLYNHFATIQERISKIDRNEIALSVDTILSGVDSDLHGLRIEAKKAKAKVNEEIELLEEIEVPDFIHHRMFYELIEVVLIHYNSLPRELPLLIPFFNPESLTVDLHSGYIIGPGLRALIGTSFKLAHCEEKNSLVHYNWVTYTPKPEKKINGVVVPLNSTKDEDLYDIHKDGFEIDPEMKAHFDKALIGILGAMVLNYRKKVLNQNVQVMLDNDKHLCALLIECRRQIRCSIPNLEFPLEDVKFSIRDLKGRDKVQQIHAILTALRGFKAGCDKLTETLEVPHLLIRSVYHAVTKEPIKENELIPAPLLTRIENVGVPYIVPLAEQGAIEIEHVLSDNEDKYAQCDNLIPDIELELKIAVINFVREKMKGFSAGIPLVSQKLQELTDSFFALERQIDYDKKIESKELAVLQDELSTVNQEQEQLIRYVASADELLNAINALWNDDDLLRLVDPDNKFLAGENGKILDGKGKLVTRIRLLQKAVDGFKEKIKGGVAKINEKKKSIEKAHAEAKFIEEMRSANPEEMRGLLREREAKIRQLGVQCGELERQRADTRQYIAFLQEAIGIVTKYQELPPNLVVGFECNKQAAIEWIESQVVALNSLYQKISDNQKFPEFYIEQSQKLEIVKRRLLAHAHIIPFQQIDAEPCFKSDDDKVPCGFEKCLAIVGVTESYKAQILQFRSRQDGIFSINPSAEETTQSRSFLFSLICKKIDELQKTLMNGKSLCEAIPVLNVLRDGISKIDLKDSEKALSDIITEKSLEKQKLEDSLPIIEDFITLQIAIKEFAIVLERYHEEPDFFNNWTLYGRTPALYKKQAELVQVVAEFRERISRSQFPQDNEQYLLVISNFITLTGRRISDMVRFKFDSTAQHFEGEIQKVKRQREVINAKLSLLSQPMPQEEIESEDCYDKTLNYYSNKDRDENICKLLEENDTLSRTIASVLSAMDPTLDSCQQLEGDYHAQLSEKRDNLKSLETEVQSTGKAIAQLKRVSLSGTLFKQLDQYIKDRADRYYVKDAFYNDDSISRKFFINELKDTLNEFNDQGDVYAVVNFIRDNMSQFPGTHFTAVLSRIVCTLIDYDSQWDANGVRKSTINIGTVGSILAELQKSKDEVKEYARKIHYLYGRIKDMQAYSKELTGKYSGEVNELATKLKETVDNFVLSRPESAPDNAELFENFNTHLMAVLHSKDDILCELGYGFWRLIGNIFIALTSLCLQPISNKISSGRFGFFASNYVQECVDRVTVTLDHFTPTTISVTG